MLQKADRRVVVMGTAATRSRSMDHELETAIEAGSLTEVEHLISCSDDHDHTPCPPRLSAEKLPTVHSADTTSSLYALPPRFRFHHATNKPSSKLLGTPTRDATGHGPSLRKAHQQIGQYLAIEYVSDVLGLAKHSITNVHGQRDVGHCLTKEDRTMIVPLMRSGEPMAMGVNDVFPQAVFFHAKNPADLRPEYLDQCEAVTLVDSVINSGASIAEFVTHVRARRGSMSIVVVTSVVRAHAVRPGGPVRNMALKNEVAIVALRLSDKKYTGKGVTDTGARLFNTTALE